MKNRLLPEPRILCAFIESYIGIRKSRWHLDENNIERLPQDGTPAFKIHTCRELIEQYKTARTFNDWINVLFFCAEREHIEDLQKSGDKFFGLAKYFVDEPLLLYTLDASLSYMVSCLSKNPEYEKLKKNLENQVIHLIAIKESDIYHASPEIKSQKLAELKEASFKLTALNNPKKDHEKFFKKIILTRDGTATTLGETSFSDFQKNALNGKRQFIVCNRLLGLSNHIDNNFGESNPTQPIAHSVVTPSEEKALPEQLPTPEEPFNEKIEIKMETSEKEAEEIIKKPIATSPIAMPASSVSSPSYTEPYSFWKNQHLLNARGGFREYDNGHRYNLRHRNSIGYKNA